MATIHHDAVDDDLARSSERPIQHEPAPSERRRKFRGGVGLLAAGALLWILGSTAGAFKAGASAAQVTQDLTVGAFLAIIVIGLAVAAYIASR